MFNISVVVLRGEMAMLKRIVFVFVAVSLISACAGGDLTPSKSSTGTTKLSAAMERDFQKGLAANNRGDYATAVKEWRPLAEQGVAAAQHNLGLMYVNGQGVLQALPRARRRCD